MIQKNEGDDVYVPTLLRSCFCLIRKPLSKRFYVKIIAEAYYRCESYSNTIILPLKFSFIVNRYNKCIILSGNDQIFIKQMTHSYFMYYRLIEKNSTITLAVIYKNVQVHGLVKDSGHKL